MIKDAIILTILFALAIAGYLVHRYLHWSYWGGICTGSSVLLAILSSIGKKQLNDSGKKIDKIIRDHTQL